jgi:hypothetical protein
MTHVSSPTPKARRSPAGEGSFNASSSEARRIAFRAVAVEIVLVVRTAVAALLFMMTFRSWT